jgi:RNA polymerase sigma-70 factor (ECF subfamily)
MSIPSSVAIPLPPGSSALIDRLSADSHGNTPVGLLNCVKDRGDNVSWNKFFQIYEPLVLKYVRRHGVPQHDAQDVVQEVMISLMRKLPNFALDHKKGRFRTWLWKVTHHAVINWRRRQRRQREIERRQRERLSMQPNSAPSRNNLWSGAENEALQAALETARKISSRLNWACFEMRLLQGRPAAEIAAELGIPSNSVYVYASRVLATVRGEAAKRKGRSHG